MSGRRARCACFVLYGAPSPGAGHSWRTKDGDGRKGSKLPDRLVGITWLCYSYHKLLRLPRGCFVLQCLLFWFSVLLCFYEVCGGAASLAHYFQVYATSSEGRHGSCFFILSFSCFSLIFFSAFVFSFFVLICVVVCLLTFPFVLSIS